MAEQKQERRTFRWGDEDFLVDDLLKLHTEYENNYYDFAEHDGKYDADSLDLLRQDISSRLQAVKNGESFDADGSHVNDRVNNVKIQTQKKGLLKKDKYVDQDITEWGKHYFASLMKKMKPFKKADKGTWDINLHGLGAFLNGKGYDAKSIYETKDLRNNPDDPNEVRVFTERDAWLKSILPQYQTWLKDQGFDYTKNDNPWDDDFEQGLSDLLAMKDYSDRTALAAYLRRAGAGDGYVTALTSDKWDLSMSDEEAAAEAKKAKEEKDKKDKTKAYNDDIASRYNTYAALAPQSAQMQAYMGEANSNFYRTPEEMLEWGKTHKNEHSTYMNRYNANRWDAEAAQYALPILQANGRLRETTIDGTTYVYDPNSIDRTNHTFIAVDPKTGHMQQRFLYDIENEIAALRSKYTQPQGAARYQIHHDGGILSMQTGGNFDAADYFKRIEDEDYEKRAAQKGMTARQLKEAERTPFGSENNTNSGWTGNDIAQLVTMAANLGSIFMDPVSGAAVGIGASTVDLINDINRDGFQGRDAWNFVKNLGMDALGLVPIVGDSLGTLGKVKKGLVQFAPKIIGTLGMIQGVANAPQIIDSFSKILDERDMTTADWQNIASGINLIVSGTRMGKNAIKTSRAKQAALQKDKLQLEVTNKAGESKLLVLDGDNAKAVRNSSHSVEDVNKIIRDIDGLQDYSVSPKSGLFDYSIHMPGKKVKNEVTGGEDRVWNPLQRKEAKANISEYYDPNAYADAYARPIFGNRGYSNVSKNTILRTNKGANTVDASGKTNLETFTKTNQETVDTDVQAIRDKAKAYGDKTKKAQDILEQNKSKLTEAQKAEAEHQRKINSHSETIANSKKKIKEIQDWRAGGGEAAANKAIADAQTTKATLEAELANLQKKPKKNAAAITSKKAEIAAQQKIIDDNTKALNNNNDVALKNAKRAKTAATNTRKQLKADLQKLRETIARRQRQNTHLEKRVNTHSQEFNDLLAYPVRKETFNGTEYEFKPTGLTLTKQGLIDAGLFKQGGSINRNKINKFLNYAKR